MLTNILELFPEKPRVERLVAYILQEYSEEDYTFEIFEHLNEMAPFQASSKRDLALIYEKLRSKNRD